MKRLFFFLIFYSALNEALILKGQKPHKSKRHHKHKNRKLGVGEYVEDVIDAIPITNSWTADEKRWDQRMRFQEEMRKQMYQAYNHYNFEKQLNVANDDNMEEVNRIYTNLRNNVDKAKDYLLDKMDNIYNNLIIPGRSFMS
jgi:hypothetical protein